ALAALVRLNDGLGYREQLQPSLRGDAGGLAIELEQMARPIDLATQLSQQILDLLEDLGAEPRAAAAASLYASLLLQLREIARGVRAAGQFRQAVQEICPPRLHDVVIGHVGSQEGYQTRGGFALGQLAQRLGTHDALMKSGPKVEHV